MIKYFLAALVAGSLLLDPLRASALEQPSAAMAGQSGPKSWVEETGTASYYGAAHHGRRMAGGGRFDKMALTAAHRWLPFGTKVKVTLAGTDRAVIVTITDRLYSKRRIVDLSLAAARQLGMVGQGIALVTLTPT